MKKHRAELYDKIQNVIGNYNDRMVRGIFQYDFDINTDILRDILIDFCQNSPVMHSAFCKGVFKHYWSEKTFKSDDLISVKYTDTPEADAMKFISGMLPMKNGIQFKLAVFKNKAKPQSILAVITSHMYMDGGDLKYFLRMLCKAYNNAIDNKPYANLLKNGSRSYRTVYRDLDSKISNKAKRLFSNPTPKNTIHFGLSDASDKDRSFIITENISAEYFDVIKEYGKTHNATINDMILAAYFLSLYNMGKVDLDDAINISSAIDLRRYMTDSEKTGITNHSSYLPYTIRLDSSEFDKMLHNVTVISHKYKSDPFTGLYGLPLLNLGYSVFMPFISDRLVKRFYNNPYLAISNIGILHEEFYRIGGCSPKKAFITGSVKYKPGIMVTVTTYKKEMTLSMCCKGSDVDRKMLEELLIGIKEILIQTKRDIK